MKIIYGHDATVAAFVASLIPNCDRGFDNCRALGVMAGDGHLVAGIVYHNWSPEHGTIEISAASITPRWLTRPVLREMFDYPFQRVACQMVLMQVSERNKGLHRQLQALGLRPHPISRLYGKDEDGIVFTLTAEDWSAGKFARSENGKEQITLSTAA